MVAKKKRKAGKKKKGRQPARSTRTASSPAEPTPASSRPAGDRSTKEPSTSAQAVASAPVNESLEAPDDETRMVIALAGLDRRKSEHRRYAIIMAALLVAIAATVGLDLAGVIEIPGVGLRARVGLAPRADKPQAVSGRTGALSSAQRARLRRRLLGGKQRMTGRLHKKKALSRAERQVAAEIFASDEKGDLSLSVVHSRIRAPDLPAGLTQKAIAEVIAENNNSIILCYAEAMRRGTVASGRLEVEITIAASGRVSKAQIATAKFSGTPFAACIVRRIRGWRFPSFSGEEVTVVYPYIISAEL